MNQISRDVHLVLMFMYLLLINILCIFFVSETDMFHGMEECKVGEATSSRYEDIKNTFDQVTITEQHSC